MLFVRRRISSFEAACDFVDLSDSIPGASPDLHSAIAAAGTGVVYKIGSGPRTSALAGGVGLVLLGLTYLPGWVTSGRLAGAGPRAKRLF